MLIVRTPRLLVVFVLASVTGPPPWAQAVDLKSMGLDPSAALEMAATMIPAVCNANKEEKKDIDCAGCAYALTQYLRALTRAEEWAILSEYPCYYTAF